MATRKTKTVATAVEKPVEKQAEKPIEKPIEKPVNKTQRRIPLDLEVQCVSNVKGMLVYRTNRIGGIDADWDEFGAVQYLDVRELINMRNTQRRFFDDNWIVIKDSDDGEFTADEIYKFLRVSDRYGNYYDKDNIDTFFDLPLDEMKEMVSKVSNGIKELLIVTACDKFERGEIDSIKKKEAIKEALGIEDEVE